MSPHSKPIYDDIVIPLCQNLNARKCSGNRDGAYDTCVSVGSQHIIHINLGEPSRESIVAIMPSPAARGFHENTIHGIHIKINSMRFGALSPISCNFKEIFGSDDLYVCIDKDRQDGGTVPVNDWNRAITKEERECAEQWVKQTARLMTTTA